jgi:hypothetical protein
MERRMAADLDRYITGNYGEDQFKDDPYHIYKNFELNWKIGDQWAPRGDDKYILARMNDPRIKDLFYTQFISTRTGNRYSEEVIIRNHHGKKDCCVFTISEICCLIYGRDISISTTDDDNVRLDDLENAHEYGPEWE